MPVFFLFIIYYFNILKCVTTHFKVIIKSYNQKQQINQVTMEMKINLDDLFGQSKNKVSKQQEDKKTTALKTHYELQDSFESIFRHNEYKFTIDINKNLFGSDSERDQTSSSSQYSHPTQISKYNFKSRNSFKQAKPGQRLYYEHKANQIRKAKQFERIRNQQISKELQENKKKPLINQHSIKILEKKNREKQQLQNQQKHIYTLNGTVNYTPFNKNRKQNQKVKLYEYQKTTVMKKQEQQMKNCTFKPSLISKGSSFVKQRAKQKVFDYLFEQQRLKQYRKKMATEEQELQLSKNSKKMTKVQFNQFIQRNDKFQQKTNKNQKIVKKTVKTYHLNSGMKLNSAKDQMASLISPKRRNQTNQKSFSKKPSQSSKIAQQIGISQFNSQQNVVQQRREQSEYKLLSKNTNIRAKRQQQAADQLFELSNRLKRIQFPKQTQKVHTISEYIDQMYGQQAHQDN